MNVVGEHTNTQIICIFYFRAHDVSWQSPCNLFENKSDEIRLGSYRRASNILAQNVLLQHQGYLTQDLMSNLKRTLRNSLDRQVREGRSAN